MSAEQAIPTAKTKAEQALAHFEDELKKIRTGRAHAGMLDGLMVEVYDTAMPINQVAGVSTPEPQLLQLTPYDPNNLQAIAKAIREDKSLGMNPIDDGKVIRVPIPPLNEERRQEYVKILGTKTEEAMISLRNARHDAMKLISQDKKDKKIGEDDAKRLEDKVDEVINQFKTKIEDQSKAKENEIMTV